MDVRRPRRSSQDHFAGIPDGLLARILLDRPSEDLFRDLALCAQVHPRWLKIVMTSPAYISAFTSNGAVVLPCLSCNLPTDERQEIALGQDWCSGSSTEWIGEFPEEDECFDSDHIDDAALRAFGTALQALPLDISTSVHTIKLFAIGPSGGSVDPLFGWIQKSPKLEKLMLNSCWGMKDEGIVALAAALPPSLRVLQINSCSAGDVGLSAIAAALPATRVRALCVGGNRGTSAGWAALGAALPQLSQLAVLDLGIGIMEDGETDIDCAGLTALVQHLPSARALRLLNLSECHGSFGDVGVQALINVLPRCPKLRVIGADACTDSDEISSALVHRLQATPETPEHLSLIEEFNCQDPQAW